MNKTLILSVIILLISCNQKTKPKSESVLNKTEDFDWLLGKWKRLNEKEGKETFEYWKKINDTKYLGVGFTIQNGDTVQKEKIQLIKTSEKWNLIVSSLGESKPSTFEGLEHNKNEFTCINNDIDFPNKIKYWKNGDKINASVSGKNIKILFEFEKLNDNH